VGEIWNKQGNGIGCLDRSVEAKQKLSSKVWLVCEMRQIMIATLVAGIK
jgi:hypothetical protein